MAERYSSKSVNPAIFAEHLAFPTATELHARSRFMKAPMSEELATWHATDVKQRGLPNDQLNMLYERFSAGGYGMIISGGIIVTSFDLDRPGNVVISEDSDSPQRRSAFKKWTAAARRHGSLFIAQVYHCGTKAAPYIQPNPLDISNASTNDIQDLIDSFVYSATYARDVGFDGIELNGGHFFLIGAFMSHATNTRTDKYGGTFENRTRIIFEIYDEICKQVDRKRFIVGIKFNVMNFEPTYTVQQFSDLCKRVQDAGFDYVTLTGGNFNHLKNFDEIAGDDSRKKEAFYGACANSARSLLNRTVLYMNGGFFTAEDMHDAIEGKWVQGVSLARAAAAEPDLPKKIIAGQVNAAIKSVVSPADFPTAKELAGTQLWQLANDLQPLDASNAALVKQFTEDLAVHLATVKKAIETGDDLVVGFTQFRVPNN